MSPDLLGRSALAASALVLLVTASTVFGGEALAPAGRSFDRAALDAELSRSVPDLRQQGTEALRSHIARLAEFYSALEQAPGVSPDERKFLGDRILARVAQVGLLAREPAPPAASSGVMHRSWARLGGAAEFLGDNGYLVIGLLGGLIVAYALGSLAGYRRGASQASYYGTGDPRLWFVTHAQNGRMPTELPSRVTLDQIRGCLAGGRTVLLQLGYEIAPKRRREYLRLMEEMQRILSQVPGHSHSVWEDPRHRNRFYEIVVCDRFEALDFLMGDRNELAGLDEKIEACWLPGGAVIRRAWWGTLPARRADVGRVLTPASSARAGEERLS